MISGSFKRLRMPAPVTVRPVRRAAPGPKRTAEQQAEWDRCAADKAHFLRAHVQIEDVATGAWMPFDLWPAQAEVLAATAGAQRVIVLKARQIGLTWLWLGAALHELVFRPLAKVLLFSKRDTEAVELLRRFAGMYDRLPAWMRGPVAVRNDHNLRLESGASAQAFPTTGGDSYTASLVIVDEADLVDDLGRLLRAVEPTINDGGRLVLISRVDKDKIGSAFQQTYLAARQGSSWLPIFLPWSARPGRDQAWYDRLKADAEAKGALDDLREQYPATDAEALAPRSTDKRLSGLDLLAAYAPSEPDPDATLRVPPIPALRVYAPPAPARRYVIGADPSEGNPGSDPSAISVQDVETGEEVASLSTPIEPAVFASYLAQLSEAYTTTAGPASQRGRAGILVERNNHGHAVLLALAVAGARVVRGRDGKPGYLSNAPGKAALYAAAADALRTRDAVIRSLSVYQQLASIEGRSLRAPQGMHDDEADAWALATVARELVQAQPDEAAHAVVVEAVSHTRSLRARLGG